MDPAIEGISIQKINLCSALKNVKDSERQSRTEKPFSFVFLQIFSTLLKRSICRNVEKIMVKVFSYNFIFAKKKISKIIKIFLGNKIVNKNLRQMPRRKKKTG